MAFPTATAIQCIQMFDGTPSKLATFIAQLNYFAKQLEDDDHTPLLNIIWMKLEGKAMDKIREIQAATWPEVRTKLKDLFKDEKESADVTREIVTLLQRPNETFDEYRERGEELYKWVENTGDFAINLVRKQFLGGLRNKGLAQAGKSQRDKTFSELLTWLKKECIDGEEIKDMHTRAEDYHAKEQNKSRRTYNKPQQYHTQNPSPRNYGNSNNNNNNNTNFNRGNNQSNNQYQDNFNGNQQRRNNNNSFQGRNFQENRNYNSFPSQRTNYYQGNNYHEQPQRDNYNNSPRYQQQSMQQRSIEYNMPPEHNRNSQNSPRQNPRKN